MRSNGGRLPSYVETEKGEWVVVRQHGRHARFRNPRRESIRKVLVDGGLITRGKRADYVVAHPKVVDVIVELKGSDAWKAIQQIRATLPVWKRCEWAGKRHGALVVRSKGIHPKEQARNEQWKREFAKTFRMRLRIETSNRDYEFEEFLHDRPQPTTRLVPSNRPCPGFFLLPARRLKRLPAGCLSANAFQPSTSGCPLFRLPRQMENRKKPVRSTRVLARSARTGS